MAEAEYFPTQTQRDVWIDPWCVFKEHNYDPFHTLIQILFRIINIRRIRLYYNFPWLTDISTVTPWPCKGHVAGCSFTPTIFLSMEDGQMEAEWRDGQRAAVWCHIGVYLSTTTGWHTSRAQPGQGQWIWLGQAAIWMARGKEGRGGRRRRRGIRRNQPANQPKTTWRMEQLQKGAGTRCLRPSPAPCLAVKVKTLAPHLQAACSCCHSAQ